MTSGTKMNRVEKLQAKIAVLNSQIKEIQDECIHVGATKVPKADTGNWCRSDDEYWYQFTCPECKKVWTEKQ
jgi:hypothetical protein